MLVKADLQSKDVYTRHTARFQYSTMLRVSKFYKFGDFVMEMSSYWKDLLHTIFIFHGEKARH